MQNNQYDTLSQGIEALKARGYTLDFNLTAKHLECRELDANYAPDEFEIEEFHRFEGISNPDDMSILYAISTKSGKKGTLVDAYGAYSDPLSAEMVQKMRIK